MHKLLAAVVVYYPSKDLANNILSYNSEVSWLLLVDNSSPPSQLCHHIEVRYKNVTVIRNSVNVGTAAALNQAISFGVANKFDWLLTMDQDSYFEPGSLRLMKQRLSQKTEFGIITPVHCQFGTKPFSSNRDAEAVKVTMTSGNLLNLSACQKCGPFDEKLFIDSVDHEYCLRLRSNGYEILRINDAVLHHQLGEVVHHSFAGFLFKTVERPPERYYYIMRNRLHVIGKYASFDFMFAVEEMMRILKTIASVVFLEWNKTPKVKAMALGTWHFIRRHFGEYPNTIRINLKSDEIQHSGPIR